MCIHNIAIWCANAIPLFFSFYSMLARCYLLCAFVALHCTFNSPFHNGTWFKVRAYALMLCRIVQNPKPADGVDGRKPVRFSCVIIIAIKTIVLWRFSLFFCFFFFFPFCFNPKCTMEQTKNAPTKPFFEHELSTKPQWDGYNEIITNGLIFTIQYHIRVYVCTINGVHT